MADDPRKRLRRVYERLSALYGAPKWESSGPAVDELVLTVLSQNTNDRNSSEGFRRLREAFADWAAVENAPWQSVAAAIRVSGLNNIKSRRIQKILKGIREERGDYSLEFLKDWPAAQANEYLRAIPGVGPKTAACVLAFSFGMPVFPVDTHILRVTKRLGVLPEKTDAETAHEVLQKLVPGGIVYPLHLLIIRHGRETCHARRPACERCVLLKMCPYGKRQMAGVTSPAGADRRHST